MFLTATTLALVVGCSSNPACDKEVTDRLLADCALVASSANGALCRGLPGDPGTDDGLDAHLAAACEIRDPDVDADCLLTADCGDILSGECSLSSEEPSQETRACQTSCQEAEQECVRTCGSEASFDACLACELDCVEAGQSCVDDC